MEWTCRCGAFAAEVETGGGIRVVCYCPSCRDFALRTDAAQALDEAGGSDLYQVAPERVRILRGADKLAWMRLTEKGPLRWYTTCCNTPVANTLATRALPFVTLQAHRFADPGALGPVAVRGFRRFATARAPASDRSMRYLYWNFGKRALKSRLTGGWKRNPFFRDDGRQVGPGGLVAD